MNETQFIEIWNDRADDIIKEISLLKWYRHNMDDNDARRSEWEILKHGKSYRQALKDCTSIQEIDDVIKKYLPEGKQNES